MGELSDLVRFFRALGDETRLGLVRLLARQRDGDMLCVGRLAQALGVSSSSVSQHLRVLKDLGLVVGERQGFRIHYRLDLGRLAIYQSLAEDQLGQAFGPAPGGAAEPENAACEDDRFCGAHQDGCSCPPDA